jgi:hypothetical protein
MRRRDSSSLLTVLQHWRSCIVRLGRVILGDAQEGSHCVRGDSEVRAFVVPTLAAKYAAKMGHPVCCDRWTVG